MIGHLMKDHQRVRLVTIVAALSMLSLTGLTGCGGTNEQTYQAGVQWYTINDDGRSLTIWSDYGKCDELKQVKVVETQTDVRITVIAVAKLTAEIRIECEVATVHPLSVTLKDPLGSRAVVEAVDDRVVTASRSPGP